MVWQWQDWELGKLGLLSCLGHFLLWICIYTFDTNFIYTYPCSTYLLYTHLLRRLMSAATWCFQSKVLFLGPHIYRPRSAPPLLPPPPLLIPPPHYHCHYHLHDHYYHQKQYHCQYHPYDSSSYWRRIPDGRFAQAICTVWWSQEPSASLLSLRDGRHVLDSQAVATARRLQANEWSKHGSPKDSGAPMEQVVASVSACFVGGFIKIPEISKILASLLVNWQDSLLTEQGVHSKPHCRFLGVAFL